VGCRLQGRHIGQEDTDMNSWCTTHCTLLFSISLAQKIRSVADLQISYPLNKSSRHIRLWDVKALTFPRQTVQRWWWDCQTYAPTVTYLQLRSWYLFLLEAEST
jgi:hypothetical protein